MGIHKTAWITAAALAWSGCTPVRVTPTPEAVSEEARATPSGSERSQPGDYATLRDVSYRSEASQTPYAREKCRLDLYYPQAVPAFSTVVWFHGGGLTGGQREIPVELKEQGIAVVAAGYRLHPQVSSPVYLQDAAAAVAWTFHNIERYGGSKRRIFVAGHSAGGYLTSMLGLDRRWLAAEGIDANEIAGLIPFSGHAITHLTVRKERGIAETQPVVDEMAPLFHVRADAPPFLLITGDRELEMLGRYEENAYLWRMLEVVEHPSVELHELSGKDHGSMVSPAHEFLLRFVRRNTPAR